MLLLLRSSALRNLLRTSAFFLFFGTVLMMATTLLEGTFRAFRELRHEEELKFLYFNNETGTDHFIVPNIIHLIRFNKTEFSFVDYICTQAAFRNHRPDHFYIHTDSPGGKFRGKYWELIERDLELRSRIRILPLEPPSEIYGQQLNPEWRLYHGGDIARIRTMMKYGGIYLDNDVYVIQNLDKYRKFEIAITWDEGQFLGTQVIIANRKARFLPLWLDSYREYHPEIWYYNAGERPTVEILYKHPELVHRVKVQFGADFDLSYNLYTYKEFDWRALDTIHLMINHRHYMDPYYNVTPFFDENVVKNYPYPFGGMAREMVAASGMENFIDKKI
uniref:Sulfotransferase sult n=2 Tax=Daphnia magna TaxID=35525 RepID=A0A0P6DHA5_9CRUS